MNTLIEFTKNDGKTVLIDGTDIESVIQWTDGFREFGSKIITKSGNSYIVKNDVHNVENSVIHVLKGVENVQNSGNSSPTLRDQFAMAALPAIIEKYGKVPPTATWAYEVADHMMAARAEKGGES